MPPRPAPHLVIDARPRGPRGPLAGELVHGRSVLSHLLDLAEAIGDGPVVVHARVGEHSRLQEIVAEADPNRVVFASGPPPEDKAVLRTDRLYDPAALRRALRRGRDPESAVLWRLDGPQGLRSAEAELTRRQSYQPLGKYWAIGPARRLARALVPTRVRPNALTLAAAALMLAASASVAFAPRGTAAFAGAAAALAVALVLDTADGLLARLQGTASEFGRWLDAYLDELSDMALHAAAAWSAFSRSGQVGWLVAGMLYAAGKYLFVVGNESWRGAAEHPEPVQERRVGRLTGSAAFSWLRRSVRMAGHADVRWHLWIVLAALGRLELALAAYAVYFPLRSLTGAVRKAVRHA
jgi:phosphatidylglycerophosphate synthase